MTKASLSARLRGLTSRESLSKHGPAALLVVLSLASALAVKRHFSRATADDLEWILAPTAWLTERILDHRFVRVPEAGYLSNELSILITPACAGVNFFIVAFVALSVGFVGRLRTAPGKGVWFVASAAVAYVAAVVVNATRIALSVHLAHRAARELGLSFQETHRLLGVVTYLGGLFALVLMAEAVFGRVRSPLRSNPARGAGSTLALALIVYVSVTLVLPLVRGAARTPEYWDHARSVGGMSLVIGGAALALLWLTRRIRGKSKDAASGARAYATQRKHGGAIQLS